MRNIIFAASMMIFTSSAQGAEINDLSRGFECIDGVRVPKGGAFSSSKNRKKPTFVAWEEEFECEGNFCRQLPLPGTAGFEKVLESADKTNKLPVKELLDLLGQSKGEERRYYIKDLLKKSLFSEEIKKLKRLLTSDELTQYGFR